VLLARLPSLPEWITFSGNGEPTLHPRLAVVVDRVLAVRAEMAPKTRVAILSNGLSAGQTSGARCPDGGLDDRIMKLDPGPMEKVNGVRYEIDGLVTAYRRLKPYTVQAMVVRGREWDGSSEESVAAWLPRLVQANPDAVQLYSLARPPADEGSTMCRGSASTRWPWPFAKALPAVPRRGVPNADVSSCRPFFFFFAVFFLALGRDFFAAFFFFFAFSWPSAFSAAGAAGLSHIGAGAGAGAGEGADGNIGSEKPGPGQLLSVLSICSSIGSSSAWWLGVAYSLPVDCDPASAPATPWQLA